MISSTLTLFFCHISLQLQMCNSILNIPASSICALHFSATPVHLHSNVKVKPKYTGRCRHLDQMYEKWFVRNLSPTWSDRFENVKIVSETFSFVFFGGRGVMANVGHKINQSFTFYFLKNINFNIKMSSKYFLNMNEVDSCHLPAENKQHLSIRLIFKRNAQSE